MMKRMRKLKIINAQLNHLYKTKKGYNSATGHFVRSPWTVSHWTFIRHLHYRLSKTCSRHIFSHLPASLTNCFQSTGSEHFTALL